MIVFLYVNRHTIDTSKYGCLIDYQFYVDAYLGANLLSKNVASILLCISWYKNISLHL